MVTMENSGGTHRGGDMSDNLVATHRVSRLHRTRHQSVVTDGRATHRNRTAERTPAVVVRRTLVAWLRLL